MLRKVTIILPALWIGFVSISAAAESLPSAGAVLDKYIEVTGGKAAYEKVHNEVSIGMMEFTGRGITGRLTVYKTEPNKSYTVVEIEGIGKIEEGTNGNVAWSRSALQGPRLKQGDEKAMSLRAALFNADLHWRDQYKRAEVVGTENVDGQDCYKLVLTPNDGSPMTRYYDKKSNLLVKVAMTLKNPMGEFPVESFVSDYRKDGGILQPHKVQQKVAGQEFVITIDSVQYNTDIPKDRFDLPSDIQALVGNSGAK